VAIFIAGITGGIGLALAREALEASSDNQVIGLARSASESDEVAALGSEFDGRLTLIDADITDPDSLAPAIARKLPDDLRIDHCLYAIGLLHDAAMSPEKRLADVDMSAMLHSYQVNTLGFLMLVKALTPWLNHRDPKKIVAVSAKVGSITDDRFGGWYAYRCSKAALNMAVHNFAIEAQRSLRPAIVVALHPGTTATPLSAPYQQSLAKLKVHSPTETASNLWQVIHQLREEDNGAFLNWDGTPLPW